MAAGHARKGVLLAPITAEKHAAHLWQTRDLFATEVHGVIACDDPREELGLKPRERRDSDEAVCSNGKRAWDLSKVQPDTRVCAKADSNV